MVRNTAPGYSSFFGHDKASGFSPLNHHWQLIGRIKRSVGQGGGGSVTTAFFVKNTASRKQKEQQQRAAAKHTGTPGLVRTIQEKLLRSTALPSPLADEKMSEHETLYDGDDDQEPGPLSDQQAVINHDDDDDKKRILEFVHEEMQADHFHQPNTEQFREQLADELHKQYERMKKKIEPTDSREEKVAILSTKLYDFFSDDKEESLLIKTKKPGRDAYLLAQELYDFMNKSNRSKERTFVSIALAVSDTKLTHDCDVLALEQHVQYVLATFYNFHKEGYIAPYFAFIQSSGMGKTKILFEYNKALKEKKQWHTSLILCRDQNSKGRRREMENTIYDKFIDFYTLVGDCKTLKGAMTAVFQRLDDEFRDVLAPPSDVIAPPSEVLVLMFDESHYLLQDRTVQTTDKVKEGAAQATKALLFRIIRNYTTIEETRLFALSLPPLPLGVSGRLHGTGRVALNIRWPFPTADHSLLSRNRKMNSPVAYQSSSAACW
jgi:hypothetical protein